MLVLMHQKNDKKMNIKVYLYTVIFLLLSVKAIGQNLEEDLRSSFKNSSKIKEVTVATSNIDSLGKKHATVKQTIVGGPDFYFVRSNDLDYLINRDHYIMVHHGEKKVLYQPQELEKVDLEDLRASHVDSMLSKVKDIKYLGIKKGQKRYQATSVSGRYYKIDILLNAQTNELEKVTYWYGYRTAYKALEMTFSKTKKITSNLLEASHYVTVSGTKVSLSKALKNYELLEIN